MTRTGGCYCGAVRYSVEGELPYVVHCHCTNCRRSHGAAFFTAAFIASENFTVTAGEEHLALSPFPDAPAGGRIFCRLCGSRVFNKLEVLFPGIMNFPVATLDESPTELVGTHVNTESKEAWLTLPDDAVQFEGFPPDLPEQLAKLLHA